MMRLKKGMPGWMVTLVLCIAIRTAPAQQDASAKAPGGETGGLRHARFHWVSTSRMFNNVNRSDARAALKVLYDILGEKKGFLLDSSVDIIDSLTEIRALLQSHSVDVITLSAGDYLKLESSGLLTPLLTDSRSLQGSALYSYVLLVNPASGATTLASLLGKTVLVYSRGGGEVSVTGIAWLDVSLAKEKLGRAASFFASVKMADKAQTCILPLFFGAVDACVVDEVDLNLAKEMNPQLGQLRVLARSRPMLESVISTPVETQPYHKDLIDAMLSLHDSPRGRQLLMVFKTDRLVRIQPGDLDSARELWRDYNALPGSSPHPPAGSRPAENNPAGRGKERH